jgi:hypothetical protein
LTILKQQFLGFLFQKSIIGHYMLKNLKRKFCGQNWKLKMATFKCHYSYWTISKFGMSHCPHLLCWAADIWILDLSKQNMFIECSKFRFHYSDPVYALSFLTFYLRYHCGEKTLKCTNTTSQGQSAESRGSDVNFSERADLRGPNVLFWCAESRGL